MKRYTYSGNDLLTKESSNLLSFVGDEKFVLEIGCAMGFQTRALKEQQRCRVVGIELDEEQASHARPFCEELIVGDIEALDLADALGKKKFDVVTFADVLEHLKGPAEALSRVKPFLNDTGYVVASIPNITHSSVIFEMAKGLFDYRPFGLLDDTHIRFFTKKTIYDAFEKAGYLIVAMERRRLKPIDTEFQTIPQTPQDHSFLQYLAQMNPEWDTYQFIVKAVPACAEHNLMQTELFSAQSQLQALENALRINQARVKELESQVAWLSKNPLQRAITFLRKLGSGVKS